MKGGYSLVTKNRKTKIRKSKDRKSFYLSDKGQNGRGQRSTVKRPKTAKKSGGVVHEKVFRDVPQKKQVKKMSINQLVWKTTGQHSVQLLTRGHF
jgi:hypothetical protein